MRCYYIRKLQNLSDLSVSLIMTVIATPRIDEYEWIDLEDAQAKINHAKLAKIFVDEYFNKKIKK